MRRSLLMTQHMIQVCECILKNINWIQWIGVLPKPKWKTINLLPKKFINWSPPFDQHFRKSTHANCWNFILICYCHFLLLLISQSSVEIYGFFESLFNFFLLLTSEVFDKRSIRVRIESTWGLAILSDFIQKSKF